MTHDTGLILTGMVFGWFSWFIVAVLLSNVTSNRTSYIRDGDKVVGAKRK